MTMLDFVVIVVVTVAILGLYVAGYFALPELPPESDDGDEIECHTEEMKELGERAAKRMGKSTTVSFVLIESEQLR